MDLWELKNQPHLSVSSINDYIDCGLLYKLGRIDKLQTEFKSDALEFGTAIHLVLGEFYRQKMVGPVLSIKELQDLFEKHWRANAEGREDIQYAEGKNFETLLLEGKELLTAYYYHNLNDGNYKIIGIEHAFSFTVEGCPVPVIGAIDLLEEDESGTIIITDFAHIKKLNNLLDGTTDLDADNPLKYDADPTITKDAELATKKYMDAVANNGSPDASTSAKGIAKLSVAPASSTDPIAVGTNDPRIPTADQKAALAGTGTPSSSNKYVTADDENLTNNVKISGDQTIAGVKTFSSLPVLPATTPTSDNQAVSKKYIDSLTGSTAGSVTDGSTTISYYKSGKVYHGITIYTFGMKVDSVSIARFCTLIGKTLDSYTYTFMHGSANVNWYLYYKYYDGTNWVTGDSGDTAGEKSASIISAIIVK